MREQPVGVVKLPSGPDGLIDDDEPIDKGGEAMKILPTFLSRLLTRVTIAALLIAVTAISPALAQQGEPASVQDTEEPEAADEEATEGDEEDAEGDEVVDEEFGEVIEVRGFRGSLAAALDRKRESTRQIDAIVAEDIADFPDTNLAESLQRIPGVAIQRSDGEGATITVRGLSGLYTRTRINGMETRAGVGGSTGRDFSFNMFASELFSSIVVHKTAAAELDEGSLGAVVDLNTGRALDYRDGSTSLVFAQGAYNDLGEDSSSRLTGLWAYKDPGDTWGVVASLAYSDPSQPVASGNTVRWHKTSFNSVRGVSCAANPGDPGCAEIADSFHARIPRYGISEVERERLGGTLGLQFRPTDRTVVSLDGLYASRDQTTDFRTIEVLFRGNEGGMDVTDYTIEQQPDRFGQNNDTIIAMTVDNAWVRSETFHQDVESEFYQVSLSFDHVFSEHFAVDGLVGASRNDDHIPVETTLMYDDRDYNGYSYDYSGSTEFPTLAFNGPNVNDATIFALTEVRDRPRTVDTGFDTAELNGIWEFSPAASLSAGVQYKKFTFDADEARRDGTVCGLGLFNCDPDGDGVDELLGAPGSADRTTQTTYPGETGPGSNTTWASPDLGAWTSFFDLYNQPAVVNQSGVRTVEEANTGAFVQLAGDLGLGSKRFQYDLGVRYVETEQTSGGFNSGVFVDVERPKYDDTLPSLNAALWLTDSFVIRAAAADVLSRPELSQLSPGGSVDSFNFFINFQNPNLDPTRARVYDASAEWYFAKESILSFAVFSKDIESFPIRDVRRGTFASTGLPVSVIVPTSPAAQNLEGTCGDPAGCWEISELTNGPGAKLDGFEVSFQTPFSSLSGGLPPVIRNMGFIGNYTYVDSDVDYNFIGNIINERLLGLSNDSYNATLYYETGKFDARVSLAHRGDFLTAGPNRGPGNLWEFTEASDYLDFSATYTLSDAVDITLEGLNLTDEPLDALIDVDARRRFDLASTGTTYLLGLRYRR